MIYPEKNKSDKLVDGINAGVQLIPLGIGSAISEAVNSFIPLGYENRRDNWFRSIGMKIEKLPDEVNELIRVYIESEEGKTLLIRATISAIETHKAEKLSYLSNVLLRVIQEDRMQYDQKEMLLSVISSLEPYDLLLLTIISSEIDAFCFIDKYDDAFELSLNNGFIGSKDEFVIIINRLKSNSLLRVSDHVDGFSDVYTADSLVVGGTSDLPKFLITELAIQLVDYLSETKPNKAFKSDSLRLPVYLRSQYGKRESHLNAALG